MSMDTFLNNFCATLTLMTLPFTNHHPPTLCNSASPTTTVSLLFGKKSISGVQHITQKCRLVDTTITPSDTQPDSLVVRHTLIPQSLKAQDSERVQYNSPPMVALAVLLTVCVVLLVVVTIALVWTRWRTKRANLQLSMSVLEHK